MSEKTEEAASKAAAKSPSKESSSKAPAKSAKSVKEPITDPKSTEKIAPLDDSEDVKTEKTPATELRDLMQVAAPPKEEEVTQIELPVSLDLRQNVPETQDGTAFEVRLYGEGCLDCAALVSSATEVQTSCHFSTGNVFCPAASLRVVFVGERMRLLSRLKKAKANGDTNRFISLMSSLESQELETKNFILRELGLLPA
jgi:hypothetical protein